MRRHAAARLYLTLLLTLCLSAPAAAAIISTQFLGDWMLVITMTPDGEYSMTKAIGQKTVNELPDVSFQAQGHQHLTIQAIYTGSAVGTPFFDVWNYRVGPTLEYTENPTLKETQFSAEQWYENTHADGWAGVFAYTVSLELRTPGGEGVPGTYAQGVLTLSIRQFRHAWLQGGQLGVSDIIATMDATEKLPVDGEAYTLRAESPVEISPQEAVTEGYGYAGYAPYTLTCPLSAFDSGLLTAKVTAEGGNAPPISIDQKIAFASVLVADWGVDIKNQLTGEWSALTNYTALYKGDLIRLQPVVVYGTVRLPDLVVQFADGQIREVTLEPSYDQSQAGEVIIEVGVGTLISHNVCWTIKFTNFIQEVTNNPRDYAKEFIWDKVGLGIATGLSNYFAPGTSWPIRKVGGKLIEYGLESLYDASEGVFNDAARRPTPYTAAGVLAESQAWRADARGAVPNVRPTAHAVLTIKSDGSMTAENRIGTRRAVNALQETRLLPPRSQVEHKSSFGPVTSLPYASDTPLGTFAVTPTGSTATRTPLLTFTYAGYGTRYVPETLDARINGFLVPAFTTQGGNEATYQIPASASLNSGANTIEASIIESVSGRRYLSGTLFASGAPQTPQRLQTVSGATSMLLTWAPSQERGLQGYHVYKGDTADSVATRLTTTPVADPAYARYAASDPGLAAGAWYAVSAVVSGTESAKSTPVQASLAGPTAAVPGAVTDLAATPAFDHISLDFTPPAGAIAFRLARPGLAPVLFRNPPYRDATASRGIPYTYTLTPLGLDLAQGTAAEVTATIAATTPPPAPTGATANAKDADGATWTLRWDPARTTGIAGFNVYESRDGGAFAKINGTLLTSPTLERRLAVPGTYAWGIRSVSSAGLESTDGPTLGGGYALPGTTGLPTMPALFLLFKR